MTTESEISLPPLRISVKLTDSTVAGHWQIRATAKFLDVDYISEYQLPKEAYIFTVPTIMSRLVHEVAHQIVVTRVGMDHASNDRH